MATEGAVAQYEAGWNAAMNQVLRALNDARWGFHSEEYMRALDDLAADLSFRRTVIAVRYDL